MAANGGPHSVNRHRMGIEMLLNGEVEKTMAANDGSKYLANSIEELAVVPADIERARQTADNVSRERYQPAILENSGNMSEQNWISLDPTTNRPTISSRVGYWGSRGPDQGCSVFVDVYAGSRSAARRRKIGAKNAAQCRQRRREKEEKKKVANKLAECEKTITAMDREGDIHSSARGRYRELVEGCSDTQYARKLQSKSPIPNTGFETAQSLRRQETFSRTYEQPGELIGIKDKNTTQQHLALTAASPADARQPSTGLSSLNWPYAVTESTPPGGPEGPSTEPRSQLIAGNAPLPRPNQNALTALNIDDMNKEHCDTFSLRNKLSTTTECSNTKINVYPVLQPTTRGQSGVQDEVVLPECAATEAAREILKNRPQPYAVPSIADGFPNSKVPVEKLGRFGEAPTSPRTSSFLAGKAARHRPRFTGILVVGQWPTQAACSRKTESDGSTTDEAPDEIYTKSASERDP